MSETGKTDPSGKKPESVLRETDDATRRQVKDLIRTARFAALAAIDARAGRPLASRVALATDIDGAPVILTSTLSGHTAAILANPACSLLVGEPGKGDPLAHPRVSLFADAVRIEPGSADHARVRGRYLARHPKAALYVDFGDFAFFRMELVGASFNGGFGRAFELTASDLTTLVVDPEGWAAMEAGAVAHMNEDHGDAVKLYAEVLCKAPAAGWKLACIDPEGLDLVAGDLGARLWFDAPLAEAGGIRAVLVDLAKKARGVAD